MSSMFPTFDIASSALTTHQIWMNAIADNIANVNTVKPMSQSAYQEKFIVAQEIPSEPGQPVGVGGGVQPAVGAEHSPGGIRVDARHRAERS